ncbi:MAG: trypsin-like peptidase domain-containing protein [Ruminococcus sp.]|nr:trypsin-like peptidase domain-containing protein [Ruminococcus sp.]MBQ8296652.1 trypsin-like peptidase domain-containing protein [Ruminococcus sp.]
MSDNFNNMNPNENNQENLSSCSYVSENTPPSSKKKPKKHRGLKAIAFVLSLAIVGGISVQGYKYFNENNPKVSDFDENSVEATDSDDARKELASRQDDEDEDIPSLIELAAREDAMSIPDIVDSVMPSVVGVSATFEYTSSQSYDSFGGWGGMFGFGDSGQSQPQQMVGTGTGIVMTADGYIVTNAHVVYDESEYNCGAAVEVSVLFSDESELEAKIIAYDTETDIAVLKVDATDLTPATFGDSDELRVGELVIAIGNPLGFDLFGSVTSGIVSALDRQISINEKNMNLIQTDAAINSGNSGGPLLNSCGQVIGINSAKMSSSYSSTASIEGLGFAIPIDEAKVIIDDLINYKYVKGRPQIGIGTRDVSETVSSYYNIPMGVYVVSVEEGSTAEFAGIQVGDVIIGIQGEAVSTSDELNEIKNQYKAGEEITLTITRNGQDIDITLVLQEANANMAEAEEEESTQEAPAEEEEGRLPR